MLNGMRSLKRQGDVGVGAAIHHFMTIGLTVCTPLSESPDYDLVVDVDGELKKVQVKTTRHLKGESYQVELRTMGGNQSWSGVCKKFEAGRADLLFVLTERGDRYLIPCADLTSKTNFVLTSKFEKYRLGM